MVKPPPSDEPVANKSKPRAPRVKAAIAPAAATPSAIEPAQRPFPIVAIGASAGGLEVLVQFLEHVPPTSGMAFVVIQHLDPNHKGMMPELLQRATAMPVTQARNQIQVKPDHVYVLPPNSDMSILHDCLYLLPPVAPRGQRLPIDYFFRALADDRRDNSIGVILSGMGSDGTLGLRAIKEHGGLIAVQDPTTAQFNSMPRSAVDTGLVDIVAAPAELPVRIANYLHHVSAPKSGSTPSETAAQKSAFDKICILLRTRTGHDFANYKRSTVYRRIERRMSLHQLDRIHDYVRYLGENPQEVDLLFKELLIGVTNFFRDPAAWTYLREQVLPQVFASYPAGTALRAWVAGCSTGEEAYTLAMTFHEAQEALTPPERFSLSIFATDLDPSAIAKGRKGRYPANIAADVSEERLQRFFIEDNGGYRVTANIREMVVFAPQNLIMDPPFTKLDILTCRNLLIYLGPELQKKLLPLFHYSLKPGGILMLGSAESIGSFNDLFTSFEGKARLFRRSSNPPTSDLDFLNRPLPTKPESIMDTKPAPITPNLQILAERLLLQQFAPAAVLVTGAGDVLYISGRTGKYLEPAVGKANWNIHAMARAGLRHELATALPKALRDGQRTTYANLRIDTNGGTQIVDLTVEPITDPARNLVLLVFTDVAPAPSTLADSGAKRRHRRSPRVAELEHDLIQAQEDAQALREEMQTSQEELKSTNEEMHSTNEELQSTNEELTTSKEEMQSLNEELQTVNVQLQMKVDELSSTNNDMKNLLDSTDLAIIFLDGKLNVRRFTTQTTRIFKLIPADIGRPLSDIVTDLDYPDLSARLDTVLRTLSPSDREITTSDGRWFQVKIMPYRTLSNVIDGIVITFNDIGRAKQLEAKLRAVADQTSGSA